MLVNKSMPRRTLYFTFIVGSDVGTTSRRQALESLKPQITALRKRLECVLDALPEEIYLYSLRQYPLTFPRGGPGPSVQWRQDFGLRKTRALTWNQVEGIINEIQSPHYTFS